MYTLCIAWHSAVGQDIMGVQSVRHGDFDWVGIKNRPFNNEYA